MFIYARTRTPIFLLHIIVYFPLAVLGCSLTSMFLFVISAGAHCFLFSVSFIDGCNVGWVEQWQSAGRGADKQEENKAILPNKSFFNKNKRRMSFRNNNNFNSTESDIIFLSLPAHRIIQHMCSHLDQFIIIFCRLSRSFYHLLMC